MFLRPFYKDKLTEAGCDEAGRGCLAGPVFAASVILSKDFFHPLLNDSKQVSEKTRDELRKIIEAEAIDFAVASIDNNEIDRINILKASFKAMHLALDNMKTKPQLLLIDGNRFIRYKKIPHQCFVKGDARFASIAAASILAKTHRDEYMRRLHEEFPQYAWHNNKGYGTPQHLQGIQQHGICIYHRKSFQLSTFQPELF